MGQWEVMHRRGIDGVTGDSVMDLRKLAQQVLDRAPDDISCEQDLVNGGDLRSKGNLWLRSSFKHSGLSKVPRESQMRLVVAKLAAKRKMGSLMCILWAFFHWIVILVSLINHWKYNMFFPNGNSLMNI